MTDKSLLKPEAHGYGVDGLDEWKSCSLKPIMARDMTLDTIHRGKVFGGRICGTSAKLLVTSAGPAIVMLVEDLCGDIVSVAVYNVPQDMTDASKMFPEGLEVEVKEPFYLAFSDGSLGIRIEEPEEIRVPRDAPIFPDKDEYEYWRTRGKDVFASAASKFGYIAALSCYDRALEAPDCGVGSDVEEAHCRVQSKKGKSGKKKKGGKNKAGKKKKAQGTAGMLGLPLEEGQTATGFMAMLLNDVSLCLLRLGEPDKAAPFAAVASVLDEKMKEAQHRLLVVMTELQKDVANAKISR